MFSLEIEENPFDRIISILKEDLIKALNNLCHRDNRTLQNRSGSINSTDDEDEGDSIK